MASRSRPGSARSRGFRRVGARNEAPAGYRASSPSNRGNALAGSPHSPGRAPNLGHEMRGGQIGVSSRTRDSREDAGRRSPRLDLPGARATGAPAAANNFLAGWPTRFRSPGSTGPRRVQRRTHEKVHGIERDRQENWRSGPARGERLVSYCFARTSTHTTWPLELRQ